MALYAHVERLFEEQHEIIYSYGKTPLANNAPRAEATAVQRDVAVSAPANVQPAKFWWMADRQDPESFKSHLADVGAPFGNRSTETPFFRHVPVSGTDLSVD